MDPYVHAGHGVLPAESISGYSTRTRPSVDRAKPGTSIRAAWAARLSGSSFHEATTTNRPSGTSTQKAIRQPAPARSDLSSSGPTTGPNVAARPDSDE